VVRTRHKEWKEGLDAEKRSRNFKIKVRARAVGLGT